MTSTSDNFVSVREPGNGIIDVLLVTSEACHFCEMAQTIVQELSSEYPIRLRTLDMVEAEGSRLMRSHRIPFPPALFVAGELLGYGRISERRLRRSLNELVSRG